MAAIYIEQVPIEVYYLGFFGFDHLQLVFRPDSPTTTPVAQEDWYVMEGTRYTSPEGAILGVVGASGNMTLRIANEGLRGQALEDEIGTPEDRGSRLITDADAAAVWATMAAHASDIADTQYRYTGYGLPSAPISTLNSTSFVTSVLYFAGFDIADYLPHGMRISPGYDTILGGFEDDTLSIVDHFNAIYGGFGSDTLQAADNDQVDRLYGGAEDDFLHWSHGIDYMHGGDNSFTYEEDGRDTLSFAGAGEVLIERVQHNIAHKTPQYIATHEHGVTWMFSIEFVKFDDQSDHITAGEGVSLTEATQSIDLGGEGDGEGDKLDMHGADAGLLFNSATETAHYVTVDGDPDGGKLWVESVEWLVGSEHNDRFFAGGTLRGIDAGEGDDLIDAHIAEANGGASPGGYDLEIRGGAGNDTIVSGKGRTLAIGGDGADRFILSRLNADGDAAVEFVIDEADASDRLFLPYNLVNGTHGGYEGSQLMPLLGAIGTYAEMRDYGYELIFEHRTLDQVHFGNNEPEGTIYFLGFVGYHLEGNDLVIRILSGDAVTETYEIDDAGNTAEHTVIGGDPATETIIRIVGFEEGDLGLMFIDPGVSYANDDGYQVYPNWDSAVDDLNAPFLPALDAKPEAPTSDPTLENSGSPQRERNTGTSDGDLISLNQPSDVDAGDGDDTITAEGNGNDHIDGGSGADYMQGGRGDDTYYVDNVADIVVESVGEGGDMVVASIDYTLTADVEDLYLVGAALGGTGNARNNRLVGNDGANTLVGLAGDDALFGDVGNDTLVGGEGSDGYIFFAGDGHDRIVDTGSGASDVDILYFYGGITASDISALTLAAAPGDLVLAIAGGGRITIAGFDAGDGVERVRFEDGTIWTRANLEAMRAAAPVLVNDAPEAIDDPVFYYGGIDYVVPAAMLLANDRDSEGDSLSIIGVSNVSSGSASIDANGNIQFAPPPGFEGLLTFTYTISDGHGGTASAKAAISVVANAAPVATAAIAEQSVMAGSAWTFALPADLFFDADGDPIAIRAALADGSPLPSWLTFNRSAATFTGTPPAGESASMLIRLTAFDGYLPVTLDFTLVVDAAVTDPDAVITGTSADESLVGGSGDDTFLLHASQNGTDSYDGGGGFDSIAGNPWNDLIGVSSLTSVEAIDGGGGTDTLKLTAGNDVLDLSGVTLTSVELIDAAAGNDWVTGSSGADIIRANAGDDTIIGGGGDDVFTVLGSTDGIDSFDGGDGFDTVLGSPWNDIISISSLANVETIEGGGGTDTLKLTAGNDVLDLSGVTLTSVELIDAAAGNDWITGSSGADIIRGNAGDDTIIGGGGDDVFTVLGSTDGIDSFDGGDGYDTVLGSPWNDIISISSLAGVESINGGDGTDTLKLTAGNDVLDLSGVTLTSIELIDAGAGNDTIIASLGNDVIKGGSGIDTFVFTAQSGHDTITDFLAGVGGDRIDLAFAGYADFSELMADATSSGGGTLITIDPMQSITLAGIAIGSLHSDNFLFA